MISITLKHNFLMANDEGEIKVEVKKGANALPK
jgi:hypothetical protein